MSLRKLVAAVSVAALMASPGYAQSLPNPNIIVQKAATERPPTIKDDSTKGYGVGAHWVYGRKVWQLQDATAGYAVWTPVPVSGLPLDIIGLHVSAAAVTTGGTGYAVGDTISLYAGVLLTVASVSSGAITGVTITNPQWNSCGNGSPIGQSSTSGAGSGATFTLSFLYPYGYSPRLLTKCYTANKAMDIVRTDTGWSTPIGFGADGNLDEATLDQITGQMAPQSGSYAAANRISISTLYDQGGSVNAGVNTNAVQATAASRPTIQAVRKLGTVRSVMCDARGTGTESWDPNVTALTLPSTVTLATGNNTVAAVFGTQTADPAPLAIGYVGNFSTLSTGIFQHVFGISGLVYGTYGAASSGSVARDTPNIAVGAVSGGAIAFSANGRAGTGTSGGGSTTITGGSLCGITGGSTGFVDLGAVIFVPWGLTAAQSALLRASLDVSFGIQPQARGVMVFFGDSHTSSYGAQFQQAWPRQMMTLLDRNDIAMVNVALEGVPLQNDQVQGWANRGALAFASAAGPNRFGFIMGDYNGLQLSGGTPAASYASYGALSTLIRGAGAKVICGIDVIRSASTQLNAAQVALNALVRADAAGYCDAKIDFAANPAFNQAAGPWSPPLFTSGDGGIHLTSQGQALMAGMALPVFARMLQ